MKLLENIVVLDLTQAYSGPFCTMHLADHGATVIKIERPGIGDQSRQWGPLKNGYSAYYAFLNRNKKGLSLDITSPEGKKIFMRMVEKADVVCENFRPGVLEKHGLGYEALRALNPGIVYASISGHGQTGPLSKRPAYDLIAQAMSGMMSLTGYADAPPVRVGPSIGDNYTGTYLALGVCMALVRRSRTGEGGRIEVAMVDTLYSALENAVVNYTVKGQAPERMGNIDPGAAPFDAFQASDGMFVLCVGTDGMWASLCTLMGREELINDPRWDSTSKRVDNYLPDLKQAVMDWTRTKTLAELENVLIGAGIPFSTILDVAQASEHPQLKGRNMLQEINDPVIGPLRVPGIPIKVLGESDAIEGPAPTIGQDTDDLLEALGYDAEARKSFRTGKVI